MTDLAQLLTDPKGSDVYHLIREPYEVEREAKAAGLHIVKMDIGHAHDTREFMAHIAKGLNFPAHFGANLDALHDCLTDLAWLGAATKGVVLVFEKSKHFGAGHKHEFDDSMEVLKSAAEFWREQGKPFYAFIHGAQGWKSGLPEWPAAV